MILSFGRSVFLSSTQEVQKTSINKTQTYTSLVITLFVFKDFNKAKSFYPVVC
jgi:hypothetical protein